MKPDCMPRLGIAALVWVGAESGAEEEGFKASELEPEEEPVEEPVLVADAELLLPLEADAVDEPVELAEELVLVGVPFSVMLN